MAEDKERAYGLGLNREGHIAFAAAYIAILLTIGAFGFVRFLPRLQQLHWPHMAALQTAPTVAYRARPIPDPAYPRIANLYPRVAILNHQQGTVVVRLLVLPSGEVGDGNVVRSSGYPQLDAAALLVTGTWRYLPAVRNGEAISSEIDVTIRFKLA